MHCMVTAVYTAKTSVKQNDIKSKNSCGEAWSISISAAFMKGMLDMRKTDS